MVRNEMVSLKSLFNSFFNNYQIYIPIIQRNYKWDSTMATDLALDLWKSYKKHQEKYTVGMITLYDEDKERNNNKMQLVDGQQRIITLMLLLKYLKPAKEFFKFEFERDQSLPKCKKRITFLQENLEKDSALIKECLYTDTNRFKINYDAIKKALSENGFEHDNLECIEGYINHILNNVYVLSYITDIEPISEFLNINKNKTRFSISDYIKAYLIIDTDNNVTKRKEILDLFQDISLILYKCPDIWNLVSVNYTCECDENRLKLLFSDRYIKETNIRLYYKYKAELNRIRYYSRILKTLKMEISGLNGRAMNWNTYHGFGALYICNSKIRFFELFGKKYDSKILDKTLFEVIWEKFNSDKDCRKNIEYFFDSQLYFNRTEKYTTFISNAKDECSSKSKKPGLNDFNTDESNFNNLDKVIHDYVDYEKKFHPEVNYEN